MTIALGLSACGSSPATGTDNGAAPAALTVDVSSVRRQPVTTTVAATGSVEPWQEVAVSSETSGIALVEVDAAEGDIVGAGEVLARLDDRLLRAQIAEQQAKISETEASVEKARADNARAETLLAKKAVSQEAAESTRTDLKSAKAQLAQAQASLDALNVQLERTVIRAPVAGTVSGPPAIVGIVVQAGTELFRLTREGRLEVHAKVPEQYLSEILKGQQVRVADATSRSVEAQVRGISMAVDPATRLGTVYVALPDQSGFRPGMSASVTISIESATVLVVPQSAFVWQSSKAGVFVVGADNVVELRPVSLGARSADGIAVTDGLADGETIVVNGAGFLNDGNTVRVATAKTAAVSSNDVEGRQ